MYDDMQADVTAHEKHSRDWVTRENFAKVCTAQKPAMAADQWGCRMKEHLTEWMCDEFIGTSPYAEW